MTAERKEIESKNLHQIALTHLTNGFVVSTAHLSEEVLKLDEILGVMGELAGNEAAKKLSSPGAYETMVFRADSEGEIADWLDLDFVRYDSPEEAEEGHELMVEKWMERG
jgi:hypothetical protein